jgi:cell division protein FtsA
MLGKQIRQGRPQAFPGLAASSAGPDCATVIGLLMAGATMPPEIINPDLAETLHAARGREGASWLSRLTGRWLR